MQWFLNWVRKAGRAELLFCAASLGLLTSLLLTQAAWTLDRTYPLSPVIEGFTLPAQVHFWLFLIVVGGLSIATLTKRLRIYGTGIALLCLSLLILLDVTRLQPWLVHYFGILCLFLFSVPRTVGAVALLDAARVIVGGIYFWSGVQKLNERFFFEVFPWFTEPFWKINEANLLTPFLLLGLCIPFIEAGFALGFFSKKIRFISILGSAGMILLVLISLGPLGNNWNSSVWPWNISIFLMVLILFYRTDFTLHEFIIRQKKSVLGLSMFALFWILPAGNFLGITDHYLSWSLYSGRVPEATLIADPIYLDVLVEKREFTDSLLFVEWTMYDMNVVPYPEVRVFTSVFAEICKTAPEANPRLEITIPRFWRPLQKETLPYDCADM